MKQIKLLLLITSLIIATTNTSCQDSRKSNPLERTFENDDKFIKLYNKTNKKISFYYNDEVTGYNEVVITDSVLIYTKKEIFLIHINVFQTPYILLPGDEAKISEDGVNKLKFLFSKEIRNNEANMFHYLDGAGKPLSEIILKRNSLLNSNCKSLISLYDDYYNKKIEQLNSSSITISPISKKLALDFLEDNKTSWICDALISTKQEVEPQLIKAQLNKIDGYIESVKQGRNYKLPYLTSLIYLLHKNSAKSPVTNSSYINFIIKNYTGTIKDYNLFSMACKVVSSNKLEDKAIIDSFYRYNSTKEYNDFITQKIENAKLLSSVSDTDELILNNKKKNKLNVVLHSLVGKVIYIDTWASWCSPCRAEMPTAEKMRLDYTGKPIAFLYLSVDTDFDEWKGASADEKLDKLTASYLLPNFEKSTFKKNYSVNAIPHYIIINKKGKVVDANAPRPSDPKLKSLLDKLIAE